MRNLYIGVFALFMLAAAPSVASADHIQACTMQYDPVCGISRDGEQKTYGNRCVLNLEHATFIHEGECSTGQSTPPGSVGGGSAGYPGDGAPAPSVPPDSGYGGGSSMTPPDSCRVWFDGCNTCSRGQNGMWMCTMMACMEEHKPYCREYEGDITQPPTRVYPVPFPDTPVGSVRGAEGSLQESFGGSFRSIGDRENTFKIFERVNVKPHAPLTHPEERSEAAESYVSSSPLLNFFNRFLEGFFGWFSR
jgi:hypothetical protein